MKVFSLVLCFILIFESEASTVATTITTSIATTTVPASTASATSAATTSNTTTSSSSSSSSSTTTTTTNTGGTTTTTTTSSGGTTLSGGATTAAAPISLPRSVLFSGAGEMFPFICTMADFVSSISCMYVTGLEQGSRLTTMGCSSRSTFVAGIESLLPFRSGFLSGTSDLANITASTGLDGGVDLVQYSPAGTYVVAGRFESSPAGIFDGRPFLVPLVRSQAKPPCVYAISAGSNGMYMGGCFTTPQPGFVFTDGNSQNFVSVPGGGVYRSNGRGGVVYALGWDLGNYMYVGGSFDKVGGANVTVSALALYDQSTSTWLDPNHKIFPGGIVRTIGIDTTARRIVIGGSFCSRQGCSLLMANIGSTRWDAVGVGIDGSVMSIAVVGSAGFFLAGTFKVLDGSSNDVAYYDIAAETYIAVPTLAEKYTIRSITTCTCPSGYVDVSPFSCVLASSLTTTTTTTSGSTSTNTNGTSTSTSTNNNGTSTSTNNNNNGTSTSTNTDPVSLCLSGITCGPVVTNVTGTFVANQPATLTLRGANIVAGSWVKIIDPSFQCCDFPSLDSYGSSDGGDMIAVSQTSLNQTMAQVNVTLHGWGSFTNRKVCFKASCDSHWVPVPFASISVAASAGQSWTQVNAGTNIMSARIGAAATSGGSDDYGSAAVIGGGWDFTRNNATNDVWMTRDGGSWTPVTTNAQWSARADAAMVHVGNTLYLMGGRTSISSSLSALNDVWISSNGGYSWSVVTPTAAFSPRYKMGVTTDQASGHVLVVGGVSMNGTLLNDVWTSADYQGWFCLTPVAPFSPRSLSAVAILGNYIVVGGGSANDVWRYFNGVWSPMSATTLPSSSSLAASAVYHNRLWVVGTDTAGVASSSVWNTDTLGKSWSLLPSVSPYAARSSPTPFVVANQLCLFGGGDSSFSYNDVWCTKEAGTEVLSAPMLQPTPGHYPSNLTIAPVIVPGQIANIYFSTDNTTPNMSYPIIPLQGFTIPMNACFMIKMAALALGATPSTVIAATYSTGNVTC